MINKVTIIANANTARKRCCCCKPLPCPRQGLRVHINQKFTDAEHPTDTKDIAKLFEVGKVTDRGIITEAIDFKTEDDMDKWTKAIPLLKGNDGNNFALRFTGYIRFDTPGLKTIKVKTDDGLDMSVNGSRLTFNPVIKVKQTCTLHSAEVEVDKGLAYIEITWYQGGSGRCLRLSDDEGIIHPSRFVHYV